MISNFGQNFKTSCRYELSDGQIRSEEGAYKDSVDAQGNPVKVLVVQGAYSWVADGNLFCYIKKHMNLTFLFRWRDLLGELSI